MLLRDSVERQSPEKLLKKQKADSLFLQDNSQTDEVQGANGNLIFMRYLGHYEIENGEMWKESQVCWICEGWQKVKIEFWPEEEIRQLPHKANQDSANQQNSHRQRRNVREILHSQQSDFTDIGSAISNYSKSIKHNSNTSFNIHATLYQTSLIMERPAPIIPTQNELFKPNRRRSSVIRYDFPPNFRESILKSTLEKTDTQLCDASNEEDLRNYFLKRVTTRKLTTPSKTTNSIQGEVSLSSFEENSSLNFNALLQPRKLLTEVVLIPSQLAPKFYLLASFNDWQPILLKSFNDIIQASYDPSIFDLPQDLLATCLQNDLLLFSTFLPLGRHYFYFVNDTNFAFLLPKYSSSLFKGATLNYLDVKPTTDMRSRPLPARVMPKKKKASERVFVKDQSVWRDWIVNDGEAKLRKMFECDMAYSKIGKFLQSDQKQLEGVKVVLWESYRKLRNLYWHLAKNSTYPSISWNDFTLFCQKVCNYLIFQIHSQLPVVPNC
ncbi:hypothetical protein FGO68_gene6696 [Halteria grandinella]|uniref:Uncharacterized protein n=1 Tax=Halteria grandinella TaxID=5974 RepID=A0A8J8P5G5_HALGN|nr:hypothetical protein FGO68_gene6696 [Halteria grandinella]